MIRNSKLDPTQGCAGEWSIEPAPAALARTPAIGREFFERLSTAYPQTAGALIFLRWEGQADDVYAVYDADPGFQVQIDPDLDSIIVWDGRDRGEYEKWEPQDDPVADALEHISQTMGPPCRSWGPRADR